MQSAATRCGVFVNNRHDDTGWGANVVAEALRRRLGRSSDVFIDNQSIGPGQPFAQVLEDGLRRSEVLVALIGHRWTEPPLTDRLFMADDWVRREILLAKNQEATVVPVLVDRENLPSTAALPKELQFLTALQALKIRQANPEDVDVLANKLAALVPPGCHGTTVSAGIGVETTRAVVENLLKRTLPPAQQWSGNRDRLVELVLALLGRDDRLVYLVPARLKDRPRGSATMIVTERDIVVAEADETFRIIGDIRFPRDYVRRVEVVPNPAAVCRHDRALNSRGSRSAPGAVPRPGPSARRPPPLLKRRFFGRHI